MSSDFGQGPPSGQRPAVDPVTGAHRVVDPVTGAHRAVDPVTGAHRAVDPSTGAFPAVDPNTGAHLVSPPRSSGVGRPSDRYGRVGSQAPDPRPSDRQRVGSGAPGRPSDRYERVGSQSPEGRPSDRHRAGSEAPGRPPDRYGRPGSDAARPSDRQPRVGSGNDRPGTVRQGTVRDAAAPGLPAKHIGPYELAAHLATRPGSRVYLARRSGLERMFAITVLSEDLPQDVVERARRGAQLAANLNHPGIVRPVDIGTFQGRLYIVSDHVPGVTLEDKLKQQGKLGWREATTLVAAAAEAVDAAHQAGVIHRDLKPRAIVIDGRDSKPKVTEFGVAREASAPSMLSQAGDLIGSPVYMSPEQLRGKPADPRCDVYALGVILYELIVGKPPFKARTLEELRREVEAGAPLPLSDRAPGANDELEEALAAALAVDPRKRPATAGKLAEQLREALGMASQDSNILSTFTRTATAIGIKPTMLVPLMGLWVVVLGGITGWAVWEHRERLAIRDQLADTLSAREQLQRTVALEQQRRRSAEDEAAGHQAGLTELREAERRQRARALKLDQEKQELDSEVKRLRARADRPAPSAPTRGGASTGALPATVSAARLIVDAEIERLRKQGDRPVRLATLLHNRGRFREALKVVDAALAERERPRLLILKARTLYKLGRASEGGPLFERVGQKYPDTPDGLFAQGLRGAADKERLLREAIAKEPTVCFVRLMLASTLLEKGTQRRDAGVMREAIKVADEAIRHEPTSFQAYWTRSLARYTVWAVEGRKPKSELAQPVLEDLFLARELHPEDPKFWVLAGKTYLEMLNNPGAAVPELLEGIRRAKAAGRTQEALSHRLMGMIQLGRAHQLLKRPDEAAKVWLEAINMAPQSQGTYAYIFRWTRRDPELQRKVLEGLPPGIRRQVEAALRGGRRGRRGGRRR